jgi:hypothetical protein
MILKTRGLQKDCGRADHLKAGTQGLSKWMYLEANLPFRMNFRCRESQRTRSTPADKTNDQSDEANEKPAPNHNHTHQQFP